MSTRSLAMEALLLNKGLDVLFQPIIDMQARKVMAFEALVRGPVGSSLEAPNDLFETAWRNRRLNELETLCQTTVLDRFAQSQTDRQLFLNVMPLGVQEDTPPPATQVLLEHFSIPQQRVVIELTRCRPEHDYQDLFRTFEHYASQGFKVSVDAFAMGKASALLWKQLLPDYLKLNRQLVADIDSNPEAQQTVEQLRRQADRLHAHLVAEGVESPAEVATLTRLGVEYMQGYYIARPMETADAERTGPSLLETLRAAKAS